MSKSKPYSEAPSVDIGPNTPVLVLDSSGRLGQTKMSALRDMFAVGRNLAKNSAYIEVSPSHQNHTVEIVGNFQPGDVITLHAEDIEVSGEDSAIHEQVYIDVYNADNVNEWVTYAGIGLDSFFKKTKTVTLENRAYNYDKINLVIRNKCANRYKDTIKIYGLSVVRGSVAPLRWAPAPEDFLSGGVICCTAVGPYRVTVTQKGGPHEHRGESAERKRTSCSIPERIGISGRESRVAGRIHSDGSVLHLPDLQNNGDAILAMGCSDGTEQSHDCSSILPNDWIQHIVSSLVAGRLVSVGAVGRDTVHGNNLLISRKEVVVA